tara:strand:+ start:327 stop:569 length:243 start_codon:yes stop_codon:yes gene_type:complete
LRPINIHAAYWKGLGFSREDLKEPRNNIEAGVRLPKSIQERGSEPTIEVIASVYNELNVGIVTNYGASVAKLYREKPWLK